MAIDQNEGADAHRVCHTSFAGPPKKFNQIPALVSNRNEHRGRGIQFRERGEHDSPSSTQ